MESEDEVLIIDIETNGLDDATIIWLIVILNFHTGEMTAYVGDAEVRVALRRMQRASVLAGHNCIEFDLPTCERLYPEFRFDRKRVLDTIVLSRLLRPIRNKADGGVGHSLESYGAEFGMPKIEFSAFETFTPEMVPYCERDVTLTAMLFEELLDEATPFMPAVELEHGVAEEIAQMRRNGFLLDVPRAQALVATFRDEQIAQMEALQVAFPILVVRGREVVTPRNNKKFGWVKGVEFTEVSFDIFNPGSRQQAAQRLMDKYDWFPTEFTPTGKPEVSEEVLAELPYPEAKQLCTFWNTGKKISMIDGKNGWLSFVSPRDGRVHGTVTACGTVTGRMTHSKPNVGQVDSDPRMRDCWRSADDMVLVGVDADGLELRCLAGYSAQFDGGALARMVDKGDKALGTDLHTVNTKLLGLHSRDYSKTIVFAFIYGSGPENLGSVIREDARVAGVTLHDSDYTLGMRAVAAMSKGFPGLAKVSAWAQRESQKGYVVGLDGRHIMCRKSYSALNFLLQSAGAILMKRAMLIYTAWAKEVGLYDLTRLVAVVHDELQIEAPVDLAETVGALVCEAITEAGRYYGFACPLSGTAHIGRTWRETH